jgi:hypothetical protein
MGRRRVVLLTALGTLSTLMCSCNAVRWARRPAEDVTTHITRRAEPRPDDCEIAVVDGDCSVDILGNTLLETCPAAPPDDREVATFLVCHREGWKAELRRSACHAGANSIVEAYVVTDACFEETLDSLSGTTLGYYKAYAAERASLGGH